MAESIPTSDINNPQSKVSAHQSQSQATSAGPASNSGDREDSVLLAVSSQAYQFQSEDTSASTAAAPWTSSTSEAQKKQFNREWLKSAPASDETHKNEKYEYNP
uniref:Uncharacterized protein n=1 Tax=Panagrolaimus sp. ES5 TaxID=591445 RepID=A0AC34GBA6_9BILA